MILTPKTKKYIEDQIILYHAIVKEYGQLREEILFESQSNDENQGGGKSNIPSRVIENRIIRLENKKLQRLEKTIESIEVVYESLDDEKKKFWHMCFWQRRYTVDGLSYKFHISRATAFRWKNKMIIDVAKELGY
mgnify:CR=1 FL=1